MCFTKLLPMKPAPPVTRTLFMLPIQSLGQSYVGLHDAEAGFLVERDGRVIGGLRAHPDPLTARAKPVEDRQQQGGSDALPCCLQRDCEQPDVAFAVLQE